MSFQSKNHPLRAWTILPALIAMFCTLATFAAAQDRPAPKWELYGGYSFFYPNTDVHGQLPGALLPLSSRLESNPRGAGASVTYDFNRWFGLTLDASDNWGSGEKGLANRIDDAAFANISFGPKITYRTRHFSPFFEVLVGDHRLTPEAFHDVDKLGVMIGGGLDVNVSRHFALRLLRADYVMSNYKFGPPTIASTDLRAVRLQTGINLMLGGGEPSPPPSATCSIQPTEVFAGEPVTANSRESNFNPKRTVKYSWSGSGVKVSGGDASTQIDTTGLQPGSYVVTASLSDGSKNGLASCSARFTVKQPRPPVISCSADPASVPLDGQSTISSNASSPDGRRLNYTYATSAGEITGNGSSATLNAHGAQPGPIQVTCSVADDRIPPLTATNTITVTVLAPPPPAPAPEIKQLEGKLALHSIYFATARPTIAHPERGLVDSQAAILEALARDFNSYLKYVPEAHLILSGHTDPRGTADYNKALSERRVERTKSFMVEHNVPADHIETRSFGEENQLTSEQIKEQMADNPDLTPEERQKMMKNLTLLVLANNRRVDVTLSTTGQQSVRRYPFNAKDFLALINPKGVETKTKGEEAKQPARKRKP
jgi:outer membrane protein OmpA-like peptidoglycan-associated protein